MICFLIALKNHPTVNRGSKEKPCRELSATRNQSVLTRFPLKASAFLTAATVDTAILLVFLAVAFDNLSATFSSSPPVAAIWHSFRTRYPETALSLADKTSWLSEGVGELKQQATPIAMAALEATRETLEALELWLRVVYLISRPAVTVFAHTCAWAAPLVARALLQMVRFQLELPAPIVAGELAILSLVGLSLWLKRHLRRKRYIQRARKRLAAAWSRVERAYQRYCGFWRSFQARVARVSRLAGMLLPHAIFIGAALVLLLALPRYTHAVTSALCNTVVYTIPLAQSIVALASDSEAGTVRCLMYWVVFAAASAARAAWATLPLASRASAYFPWQSEAVFFSSLWMLLPLGGLPAIFRATVNSLGSWLTSSPRLQSGNKLVSQAQTRSAALLSHLAALRIISEATQRALLHNVIEGAALSAGLVFLFTPAVLTRLGSAYVGYLIPVRSTVRALGDPSSSQERSRSLRYWVVMVTYSLVYGEVYKWVGWVPLLPIDRASLLFLIWLQLPYFCGADVLCRTAAQELGHLVHSLGLRDGSGAEGAGGRGPERGSAAPDSAADDVAGGSGAPRAPEAGSTSTAARSPARSSPAVRKAASARLRNRGQRASPSAGGGTG